MSIEPFRGRLVDPDWIEAVSSPAYDALSIEERRKVRAERPDSYLHVTRSAADEPDGDIVDSATLVARGRASLERLLAKQVFRPPAEPAFHVYRLATPGHVQIGLVGEVDPHHFALRALPHEGTQIARAKLLAQHFLTVGAASSPIACAIRDTGQLEDDLRSATQKEPELDFSGADGLRQSIWRVDDPELAARLRSRVESAELYIIDGHHRAAASRDLMAQGYTLPVLVAIFPARSLKLEGFHRFVTMPDDMSESDFVAAVGRRFAVERCDPQLDVERGTVAMFADGAWHRVQFDERPVAGSALVRLGSLDPSVLEREILWPILSRDGGPPDVTFVPATAPFDHLLGEAAAAGQVPIFVAPVELGDLFAAADGGLVMPAKSTFFTPKVRSGIFLRDYDVA